MSEDKDEMILQRKPLYDYMKSLQSQRNSKSYWLWSEIIKLPNHYEVYNFNEVKEKYSNQKWLKKYE